MKVKEGKSYAASCMGSTKSVHKTVQNGEVFVIPVEKVSIRMKNKMEKEGVYVPMDTVATPKFQEVASQEWLDTQIRSIPGMYDSDKQRQRGRGNAKGPKASNAPTLSLRTEKPPTLPLRTEKPRSVHKEAIPFLQAPPGPALPSSSSQASVTQASIQPLRIIPEVVVLDDESDENEDVVMVEEKTRPAIRKRAADNLNVLDSEDPLLFGLPKRPRHEAM
jgi:hypothetical protein